MGVCTHPIWCLGNPKVSAAALKAFTLRQYGMWLVEDDEKYYDGRYLTYSNNPARRLRRFATHKAGDSQWAEHLNLLQEQLQDFQSALAAAISLNRTLVLPRMLCSCVYAQWPFITSGNLNCQPLHMQGLYPRLYECPPSYWLSLPNVMRTDISLREPGFIEHTRAAHLRSSHITLHLCDPPRASDGASTTAAAAPSPAVATEATALLCTSRGVPLVRARSSSSEFRQALSPLHNARVLHLEAPRFGVGGFSTAGEATSFARRAGKLLGSWCCAETEGGGGGQAGGGRRMGGGGRRRRSMLSAGLAAHHPALNDVTEEERTAIGGLAFRLRFRPKLGVLNAADKAVKPKWEVVSMVNNVFGRAELRKDTSCCRFIGNTDSLDACTKLAEARLQRVTSVTWHRHEKGGGPWSRTCYGIIDGTWQPVAVEPGQAAADSARLIGPRPLGPAPELATPWVSD